MIDIEKDNTIHIHKGDRAFFGLRAKDKITGEPVTFKAGDVVRIKVYGKKNVSNVVLQKDFLVETPSEEVIIYLDSNDTSFGGNINTEKEYNYEVSRDPDTTDEDTIIGHFKEGPVSFWLYPEGAEFSKNEDVNPEVIPAVDDKLDINSERPVQNRVIASAFAAAMNVLEEYKDTFDSMVDTCKNYIFEDITDSFITGYSGSAGVGMFEFFELSVLKRGKLITVDMCFQLKERYNIDLGGGPGVQFEINKDYAPRCPSVQLESYSDAYGKKASVMLQDQSALGEAEDPVIIDAVWAEDERPVVAASFSYFCK